MSVYNEMIVGHIVRQWVDRAPDREIVTFVNVDTQGQLVDERRTYSQLWQNGQRFAEALQNVGMVEGKPFAILMQNHPEFVDLMVASSIANTVFVPIDPRTRGKKLVYMLDHAECSGIVVADYCLPQLREVLPQLEHLRWVFVLPTGPEFQLPNDLPDVRNITEILEGPVPEVPMLAQDESQPMQMLYTSGTTGDPKAILASYARFGQIASLGPAIDLRDGDRPYTGLSLTHANAQLITLGNVLKMGLPGVFSRKFTKSRLWDICRAYECTMFNLLGGMTTAIYAEPPSPDDTDNPVRYVFSAGMPASIWEGFARRFDVDIFEFYGTAEGGVTLNPPGVGPVGSIGKPPDSLVARVFEDNDNECAPGEPGELVFRNADGSCPAVQYFKDEEASEKKTRDGWLRTGDICSMDENGWLYFHYRKGDAIRHNGDFVNPSYIEKEMAEHDQVDDVFVYGIPAASGVPGEQDVVATVVLRNGHEFDVKHLFDHCRGRLERNSVPTYIQVMEEIPKTPSEKPQRRFCVEAMEKHPESVFMDPQQDVSNR